MKGYKIRRIILEVYKQESLYNTILDMIKFASKKRLTDVIVCRSFNDWVISVKADSNPDLIYRDYTLAKLVRLNNFTIESFNESGKQQTEIGPTPAEISDKEKEEILKVLYLKLDGKSPDYIKNWLEKGGDPY